MVDILAGMALPNRPPQRKPRGQHPNNALTPAFVRNVSQAGRYCDGHGLYLDVRPTGSRGWVQRLTIRGRRTELGLGGFPLVSLKEAREKAFANRKLARDGGDLLAEKRRAESMPTFAEAAGQVWNQLRPGWRSPQHAQLWLKSLERYAIPRIGEMPIAEVSSADVIGILAPIWHDMPPTARKLRQRIRAVMEWAVAMDLRPDNPCDRIGPVLGEQGGLVRHMPALLHGEVASAIETVRASNARPVVKLAFEFLVLTAVRSGEVRGAAWTEIDRDAGVWTIPAPRTKGNREHRVPPVRACVGDPRGSADARSRRAARVSGRAREAIREHGAVGTARGVEDRGRAARLSFELSRLGGRRDGPPSRGGGGGAGAQGPQPDRGGVPALGPVRAPTPIDERLGCVPSQRASRRGGRTGPLRRWLMTVRGQEPAYPLYPQRGWRGGRYAPPFDPPEARWRCRSRRLFCLCALARTFDWRPLDVELLADPLPSSRPEDTARNDISLFPCPMR